MSTLCRWRPKVSSLRTLFVSTSGYQNGRDHQWPPRYELNLKLSIFHSFQDGKQTLMFFVPPKPPSAWLPFQVSSWNSMRRQQPKPSWPPDRKRCGLQWFNSARKTLWKNTLRMEESSTNGAFLHGGLVVVGRGSLFPLPAITPHVIGIYYITRVWVWWSIPFIIYTYRWYSRWFLKYRDWGWT